MARHRSTGRRKTRPKTGGCKSVAGYGRNIKTRTYSRSAPGKSKGCLVRTKTGAIKRGANGLAVHKKTCTIANGKLVKVKAITFCSSRTKATKKKKATTRASTAQPSFTKTGKQKPAKKDGRCPANSNRTRKNKDAATGRKGGYAKKAGAAARRRRSTGRSARVCRRRDGSFKKCR